MITLKNIRSSQTIVHQRASGVKLFEFGYKSSGADLGYQPRIKSHSKTLNILIFPHITSCTLSVHLLRMMKSTLMMIFWRFLQFWPCKYTCKYAYAGQNTQHACMYVCLSVCLSLSLSNQFFSHTTAHTYYFSSNMKSFFN